MDEFGTGSLMDEANPALEQYRNSAMWNPARHDTKIRSRPNAPGQVDIFGRPVRGKGKGGHDRGKGIVSPSPHLMPIQTARWMRDHRMRRKLKKLLDGSLLEILSLRIISRPLHGVIFMP